MVSHRVCEGPLDARSRPTKRPERGRNDQKQTKAITKLKKYNIHTNDPKVITMTIMKSKMTRGQKLQAM